MLIPCIIVALSRNTDGSFRATLQSVADVSIMFQITLAAAQATNAYIGRAVNVTLAFA